MAKKKLLLVDDEVSFTRLLKLNLERTGKFEVRTENKGTEAAQAARSFRPDLIILDVIMPDMDGSEVANRLKDDPLTRSIPILFLTALVKDQEIESTSGTIGGHLFLAKPITTEQLVRTVEKILGDLEESPGT